jgi:transposase
MRAMRFRTALATCEYSHWVRSAIQFSGNTVQLLVCWLAGRLNRPGFIGGSIPREDGVMARPSRFSPEVRERAVRMVFEHAQEHASQWAAITSIAEKIGCAAETLRSWVRRAERDGGRRPGLTTDERARFKQLERENVELRRANEILRLASAYFAKAELDRRAK